VGGIGHHQLKLVANGELAEASKWCPSGRVAVRSRSEPRLAQRVGLQRRAIQGASGVALAGLMIVWGTHNPGGRSAAPRWPWVVVGCRYAAAGGWRYAADCCGSRSEPRLGQRVGIQLRDIQGIRG
jgi:hypothetical protein